MESSAFDQKTAQPANQEIPESRIAELRKKERHTRTTEENIEVITDTIANLAKKRADMATNGEQYTDQEKADIEDAIADLKKQREEMRGEVLVASKQEELAGLEKQTRSADEQNERAFRNPDREAFVTVNPETEKKITSLRQEILTILDQTAYRPDPVQKQEYATPATPTEQHDPLQAARDAFVEKYEPSAGKNKSEFDAKRKAEYERLGIKLYTKEELYPDRVANSIDLKDLVSRMRDLGDIIAPDGHVYKKDDLIETIVHLTGPNDPNLAKITRIHGLRDKVAELLVKKFSGQPED